MNLLLDIPSDFTTVDSTSIERPFVPLPLEPAGPSDEGFDAWLDAVASELVTREEALEVFQ